MADLVVLTTIEYPAGTRHKAGALVLGVDRRKARGFVATRAARYASADDRRAAVVEGTIDPSTMTVGEVLDAVEGAGLDVVQRVLDAEFASKRPRVGITRPLSALLEAPAEDDA